MDEVNANIPNYHVLTPKTDIKESVYFEAIDFALKDKSMHNLAISGPYGAGKSSVIHSFINTKKNETDENKKVLIGGEWSINDITITLGHLCTDAEEEIAQKTSAGETKQEIRKKREIDPNLIEYSILEQLFFHDNGANLPESQFSRIKPISWWDLMAYVFYIVFFGACVFAWFYRQTLGLDFPGYMALVIFSVLSSFAVYKLFPIIRNLSIRKISLATASLEIGNGKNQSVLNLHLDEILYYFQQTGINLVIFEDLDRFDNPDLFVKLREINYLVNNANSVEQQVVFVYALRDDMFLNKQRTKFFDFIVPIIPYVDGKNAVDKLYAELEDSGIDDRLCEVLSYHIGEMRMVYNIVNEYQIYKALKSKEANYSNDELLAIVAYKNCYPKDFAALLTHQGVLYDIMNKKNKIMAIEKEDIERKLSDNEEKVRSIQQHQQSSIRSLRLEYINALLNEIPNKGARLGAFDQYRSLEDWTTDGIFRGIISGTSINYIYPIGSSRNFNQSVLNYKFSEIEKKVDTEHTYSEREKFIQDRHKLDKLLDEIGSHKATLSYMEDSRYVNLLHEGYTIKNKLEFKDYHEYVENEKVFDELIELLEDLLSFDFVNENYMECVSLFHAGLLGPKDQRFYIDVLRNRRNPYEYKLEKAEKVVEKIDAHLLLTSSAWWNFDLVDAMLRAEASSAKVENMARSLSDTDGCTEFINEYVHNGHESDRLVAEICNVNDEIWRSLINNTTGLEIDKDLWAKLILRNANIEQIRKIFDKNESAIADMSDYFHIQGISKERLCEIAEALDIKFSNISIDEDLEHRRFMLKNNLYAITPEMLRCVLSAFETIDEKRFTTANYTYLCDTKQEGLIAYVESNIVEYVNNVLLSMPTNTQEETIHESALLVDDRLSNDLKEKLIKQGKLFWDSVKQWDSLAPNVELMLYVHNRVMVSWENVCQLFELDKKEAEKYISQKYVLDRLKQIGAPKFDIDGQEKWQEMQREFIQNPSLKAVNIAMIDFYDIEFEQWTLLNCDYELLKLLIEKGRIAKGVYEFELLRGVDRDMALDFFVDNYANYSPRISEMKLDDYDIAELFKEERFNLEDEQKLHILESVDAEKYVSEFNFDEITNFLFQPQIVMKNISQGIKDVIGVLLILENEPVLRRIELFNKFPIYTEVKDINYMISSFGSDYFGNGHLKYRIPNDPITNAFCKQLEKIGYLKNHVNYHSKGFITAVRYQSKV